MHQLFDSTPQSGPGSTMKEKTRELASTSTPTEVCVSVCVCVLGEVKRAACGADEPRTSHFFFLFFFALNQINFINSSDSSPSSDSCALTVCLFHLHLPPLLLITWCKLHHLPPPPAPPPPAPPPCESGPSTQSSCVGRRGAGHVSAACSHRAPSLGVMLQPVKRHRPL